MSCSISRRIPKYPARREVFVLWPLELDKKLDVYRLYQEALKHQISIAPGRLFSAQGQFGNCLRISYARPWDKEVEDGLKTLAGLIRKMI